MEELGFAWPSAGIVSPAAIPLWLQEQVSSFSVALGRQNLKAEQSLADLGLPINGSDGIFISPKNGWIGDFAPMPEAW